jgi:hypothetical protein
VRIGKDTVGAGQHAVVQFEILRDAYVEVDPDHGACAGRERRRERDHDGSIALAVERLDVHAINADSGQGHFAAQQIREQVHCDLLEGLTFSVGVEDFLRSVKGQEIGGNGQVKMIDTGAGQAGENGLLGIIQAGGEEAPV